MDKSENGAKNHSDYINTDIADNSVNKATDSFSCAPNTSAYTFEILACCTNFGARCRIQLKCALNSSKQLCVSWSEEITTSCRFVIFFPFPMQEIKVVFNCRKIIGNSRNEADYNGNTCNNYCGYSTYSNDCRDYIFDNEINCQHDQDYPNNYFHNSLL